MLFLTSHVKSGFLATFEGITQGSLRLRTSEGECHDFGQGAPEAELHIHDWSVVTATLARGDIGFGETYVAGLWDTPSVELLIQVAIRNLDRFRGYAFAGFWQNLKFRAFDRLLRLNSRSGALRNIRAHYDVGNEFFQLWLDPGMTYSSALFQPGDDDLMRAQNRKHDRILDRLNDGARILEFGCGWGGFAERAADRGRAVTGLTISPARRAMPMRGWTGGPRSSCGTTATAWAPSTTSSRSRWSRLWANATGRPSSPRSRRGWPGAGRRFCRRSPCRTVISTPTGAAATSSASTHFPAACCCRTVRSPPLPAPGPRRAKHLPLRRGLRPHLPHMGRADGGGGRPRPTVWL
jgi:hypothetical protein